MSSLRLAEDGASSASGYKSTKQRNQLMSLSSFIKILEKKRLQLFIAFVIFALIALAAYWPIYPLDPHTLPDGGSGDISQSAWFLAWAPFAVFHHINPYSTTWLNYPIGANLAISSQYFLYGILLTPITYGLNAIASYNLLIWLAYPLSAIAMFWVTRRYINHFWPAFVAALFYGFSPYMAGEGMGHLNLIFIPFPPLILCSVYEIFTSHEHRYRWGIALGIFVIFQYMMSSELLATTALITLIALFILAIANPGKIKSASLNAVGPLTLGMLIALLALFYPIWYSLDGPQHLIAPIHVFNNQFHADLLGTIFPTIAQKLYPSNWLTRGTSFLQGNWDENGSYLGIPLLILLVGIGIRLRKNRWVRFSLIMAIVAWVISLGPYLTIDNHTTSIPLPFDLMSSIPLLNNILSSRIAMYSDLFIALILALGVEQIYVSHEEHAEKAIYHSMSLQTRH